MKTILVITDGIGFDSGKEWNAFEKAKKPTYDLFFKEVPHCMIKTYGDWVGLPDGQMGNSEVGHMTLGSGRVLYQDLVKINRAIRDNTLFKSQALETLKDCKIIHLVGLMSDGGVHSHINHTLALMDGLAQNHQVFLHLITDGRDVLAKSAPTYLQTIQEAIDKTCAKFGKNKVRIASMCGRFYAMDRDNRWDRIQLAFESIALGKNPTPLTPLEYLQEQYKSDEKMTDEFITPASFGGFKGIECKDGIIFTNFRSDRAREIVTALGAENFTHFSRGSYKVAKMVNMTPYDATFPYPIIFPKEDIKNTLGEILSKAKLRQFHTAETEKYAHVTFFFNGGRETPFELEDRVLIPSPKVKTYDLQPQMSADEVSLAVLDAMDREYDFIVVNFANGDMVGHTGNFNAAIKAVEAVDTELGKIYQKCKEKNYALVLTSDHGNCEKMRDEAGNILPNHTVGEVWCFIAAPSVKELRDGSLDNIAPTVLKLLGLPIPKEMSQPLF